ncbi:metallophosphoesterase [Corynebacterium sp. sy017]|uniref:metallophosphoesterase n=1 Tax=unclassified Corynebacterium TaxID=2624378 RepID=UPI0011859DB9|nr:MULTISPECIES: metallophosphoesterase [unclassified Corynebacterium]MBP3089413.1 metallophosphoesterase [Corynebacterium sp. sy017]TSD90900.1 metallophosphoesterase [Corynebacterium sp. SY003]
MRTLLAGLGIASAATTIWGIRECEQFELKEITLPLLAPGTLRGAKDFKILHISDLHMVASQTKKQQWVAQLDALQPDLVVNTGDNLSDPKGVPGVLRALNPLLKRPGIFVFGSNDYYAPRMVNPLTYLLGKKRKVSKIELPWQGMRAAFVEHGWYDANQRRHEFQIGHVRIAATGVDDPHHDLDNYTQIQGAPHHDADLSLALLHSPEPRVLEKFEQDGYMLSLSGHTHGGQICLPGSRAIVTNCGIDRRRAQGLHRYGNLWMHVSNGLGTSRYAPVRLFCRPSATLLRIQEQHLLQ